MAVVVSLGHYKQTMSSAYVLRSVVTLGQFSEPSPSLRPTVATLHVPTQVVVSRGVDGVHYARTGPVETPVDTPEKTLSS